MIIYSEKEQSPVSERYTPNSLSNPIIPNYGLSLFILSKEQEKPEKSSTEEKDLFPTSPKIIDIGYDIFNLLDESKFTTKDTKELDDVANNSVTSENIISSRQPGQISIKDHSQSLNNSMSSMNKEVFQNPPISKSLFQPQPKPELYDSPPPKLTNPITLGIPFPQLQPVVPQAQNGNIQESKYALMSIQDITSQLQSIAKKQIGCRYLQKLIASSQEDIVNKYFFPHLYPTKLLDLCQDFFGNYFIQKLIPYLSQENLSSISFLLLSHFQKLSTDPHGTRVIQSLNSQVAHIPILLTQFTNAMKMCIPQLINDHNGSFVLLHYATCVPYPNNEIVYQYLNKNIVEVATSPYACCTLQKSIDIANDLQRETLLNTIAEYSMYLVSNQFGNYVIQFALTKNNIKVNDKIAAGLIPNIIFLSKQKYSSNVIEKCFDYCSPKMKEVIINKLCDENNIKELLRDMYGNYVLQKAILNSKENIKNYFLNIIVRDINNLQYLTFGQKLITKLILTFPELRPAVNFNMMGGSNFNQNMFMMNQQMGNMNIGPGPFYQNGFGKAKYQKGKNNNMWNMQNFSNNDSYGNYQYNK